VRCLYHYSQEHMVVCSLATAKGVHTSGGNCKVNLPDKSDQVHMSCHRRLSVLLQNLLNSHRYFLKTTMEDVNHLNLAVLLT